METALLATIGVVFAGALSLLGVVLAQIASRLRNVELDLLKARLHERALGVGEATSRPLLSVPARRRSGP